MSHGQKQTYVSAHQTHIITHAEVFYDSKQRKELLKVSTGLTSTRKKITVWLNNRARDRNTSPPTGKVRKDKPKRDNFTYKSTRITQNGH